MYSISNFQIVFQPKIPERRKTPIKIKRLEPIQKLRLPSPDATCSPAVTRWKKASTQIKCTPEILKQARLEKQLKKTLQQGIFKYLYY